VRKFFIITLIFSSILLVSCASRDANEPYELAHIAGLKSSESLSGMTGIRLNALRDTAVTVGAQAGLAWRAEEIRCMLKEQSRTLDHIYNFHGLMLRNNVLPPVLAEGRRDLNIADCDSIRTADTVYRMLSRPCFVAMPPHWRDYIWLKFEQPEEPNASLLPKTHEEATIWNCYVRKGWQQGIEQAEQIFAANLARLNRDYKGMVLYHKLYAQNMVSEPFVAKSNLGVTGDSREMRVNDRILRITATSQLNTNSHTWKAAVWNERHRKLLAPEHQIHLPEPNLLLDAIPKKNMPRRQLNGYLIKA